MLYILRFNFYEKVRNERGTSDSMLLGKLVVKTATHDKSVRSTRFRDVYTYSRYMHDRRVLYMRVSRREEKWCQATKFPRCDIFTSSNARKTSVAGANRRETYGRNAREEAWSSPKNFAAPPPHLHATCTTPLPPNRSFSHLFPFIFICRHVSRPGEKNGKSRNNGMTRELTFSNWVIFVARGIFIRKFHFARKKELTARGATVDKYAHESR